MTNEQQYSYLQPEEKSNKILEGIVQMLPDSFVYKNTTIPVKKVISTVVSDSVMADGSCAISIGLLSTTPVDDTLSQTKIWANDEHTACYFEDYREADIRVIAYAPDAEIRKTVTITVKGLDIPSKTYDVTLTDYCIKDIVCDYPSKLANPPYNNVIRFTSPTFFNNGDTIQLSYTVLVSGMYLANELIHNIQKNIDTYIGEPDNLLFKDLGLKEYYIGTIVIISDELFIDTYHGASFDLRVNYPTYRYWNTTEGDVVFDKVDMDLYVNESFIKTFHIPPIPPNDGNENN